MKQKSHNPIRLIEQAVGAARVASPLLSRPYRKHVYRAIEELRRATPGTRRRTA